ncbi:SRPBCC domain-containing protein [Paenibacillus thailandensis]|uniref:SRPBCC domain-containing protein n=1 Tax=Paenibacillus thailandensis TaxID=393250 RepID=A0ABW5R0X6_9BACL
MNQRLIVHQEIEIDAPASNVWQVLVKPEFIKQWDDVPESFDEPELQLGSELVWHLEEDEFTQLTVTELVPFKRLRTSLYVSNWEPAEELGPDDIGYLYELTEREGRTALSITVGDFGKLADGERYYEATIGFAEEASAQIKRLAEGLSS